jgi:1-acyl-sn-glycerol-3-phosphate acyltransferase
VFNISYVRALLITDPLIILATILMGSVSVIASFVDRDGGAQDAIARAWSRILLRISGVRVRTQGLERLDLDRSYVFAGNHLSLMDTPVVLGNIPIRFLFLVYEKYMRLPFLGTHLRRAGHLSVVSGDPRASFRSMTEAARIIQQRNISILLFPEGRRSTGGIEEFKEGAAYIAIKAGVPIVPIRISGTREVLPVGSVNVRPGAVELRIGDPIPTATLTLKDRGKLTEMVRDRVVELL